MEQSFYIGILMGVLSAALTDYNAYLKSGNESEFNWKLASIRWLVGAVIGFLAGFPNSQWTPVLSSIFSTIAVDLNSWYRSGEKFDWKVFQRRLIGAIITGITGASIFGQLGMIPIK